MLQYSVEVKQVQPEVFKADVVHKVGKRLIKSTEVQTFSKREEAEVYQENMDTLLKAFQTLKRRGY